MRFGVDTGGTFTDCVVLEQGEVKILKVFSTPEDASRGILEGVRRLAESFQRAGPLEIIHGTTVGTNSLLERRGARVALVTTEGFEDLIEIGRQARPRLYDLDARQAPPLVSRTLRFGVRERTAADGTILQRPSAAGIARLTSKLKGLRAESIAVCFLFSYLNPANERVVAQALKELQLPISVSHEILPEFREYERLATVVINAFLAPRMGGIPQAARTRRRRRCREARYFLQQSCRAERRSALGRAPLAPTLRGRSRAGLRDAIERGNYDGGASGRVSPCGLSSPDPPGALWRPHGLPGSLGFRAP